MDIRQLKYFITIIDEGSISGAARVLHMSQPPLSMQIQQLEEELGCKLLERNTRHIYPTEAGLLLYKRANAILDLCASTRTELLDITEGVSGNLRIGAISSVCSTTLVQWISQFHQKYEHITFDIKEANTYELIDMVRSGSIDLALVRTPFNAPDLKSLPLNQEALCVIGKDMYLKKYVDTKQPMALNDLADLPLIIYRRWENILRNAFVKAGLQPKIICINDDARTTADFAAAGLGVGIVPTSMNHFLEHSGILLHPLDIPDILTCTTLICRQNVYLPATARLFIEEMKKNFSENQIFHI